MTAFSPAARATVLIPTPSENNPDLRHLFIVLNNAMSGLRADIQDGVLIVGISSLVPNRWHDPTCCLYVNDHPFVKHDSYVRYSNCQLKSAASIVNGVRNGSLVPKQPIEPGVFARVLNGVPLSRHTPREIKDIYKLIYPG